MGSQGQTKIHISTNKSLVDKTCADQNLIRQTLCQKQKKKTQTKQNMWAVKPLIKHLWEGLRQFSSRRGKGPIHRLNFSQFEELYSPPGRLFKRDRSSFRTWVTLASFRLYSWKCPQQRQKGKQKSSDSIGKMSSLWQRNQTRASDLNLWYPFNTETFCRLRFLLESRM